MILRDGCPDRVAGVVVELDTGTGVGAERAVERRRIEAAKTSSVTDAGRDTAGSTAVTWPTDSRVG